jgi:hypothetical protein
MATDLQRTLSRFCDQLRREGYVVEHELVGDLHVISACEWDGEVAHQYFASLGEAGLCIEEVRD